MALLKACRQAHTPRPARDPGRGDTELLLGQKPYTRRFVFQFAQFYQLQIELAKMLHGDHFFSGLINALDNEKQSVAPNRTDMESHFRAGDINANFVITLSLAWKAAIILVSVS
jgi:hypothetical protein